MGKIWRWFLQGIALIALVALTIALLAWLGTYTWSENTFGGLIKSPLPVGWYFKILGLLSGLVVTLAVGQCAGWCDSPNRSSSVFPGQALVRSRHDSRRRSGRGQRMLPGRRPQLQQQNGGANETAAAQNTVAVVYDGPLYLRG